MSFILGRSNCIKDIAYFNRWSKDYFNLHRLIKYSLFISYMMVIVLGTFASAATGPLLPGTTNPGPGDYYRYGTYTGCTASDMTVTGWGFTSSSCAGCGGGTTGSGTIKVTVTATAQTRYNVYLLFSVNGNPYRVFVKDILSGSQYLEVPVTWTCTDQTKVTIGGPGKCGSGNLEGPVVRYDNDDLRKKYCDFDIPPDCGATNPLNDVNCYEVPAVYDAGPKCVCLGSFTLDIFSSTATYTQPCNVNADGTKTITFTQTANGGTPGYSYSWDWENDGTYDSNSNPATHNFLPGTYIVKYKAVDSAGCIYQNLITVIVYSALDATVTNTQPCSLIDGVKPVTFTTTATGGNPGILGYKYSWDWNNDGVYEAVDSDLTSNTATHNFAPGTYTIRWKVKDGSTPPCEKPGTITFTVYPDLTATVVYTQPCDLINGLKTVTFTSTALGGNPGSSGYKYSWDWNNDGIYEAVDSDLTSNTATHGFAPGTYTIGWMVKDGSAPPCEAKGTTSITVYSGISATVAYTQPCALTNGVKTVTFTSTALGGNPGSSGYKYSWDWNNDGIYEVVDSDLTSNTATHDFAPGTYTIGWKVKDGSIPPCETVGTTVVIVAGVPTITALTPDQIICSNQNVQLSGSADNADSYAWAILSGPGDLSSYVGTTTTFTPEPDSDPSVVLTQTVVQFTAYGKSPCETLSDSKSLTITVYQMPAISLSVFPI